MNNSTMNDLSWVNFSGLPEMPSLVRIDKEAIIFALIKLVKIANRPHWPGQFRPIRDYNSYKLHDEPLLKKIRKTLALK